MRKILLYIQFVKWSILQGYYQAAYECFGSKDLLMKSLAYHDLITETEQHLEVINAD